MKKFNSKKITKRIVSCFIAFIIAFLPLFGCSFSVSAEESSPANMFLPIGSFSKVGFVGIMNPTSNDFIYDISSTYTVNRQYYGEAHWDLSLGPSDSINSSTLTMKVHKYSVTPQMSYSPVSIMQIHLKSDVLCEPGETYQVTFDVTPAPGFAGWNNVYVPNVHRYESLNNPANQTVVTKRLSTNFYRFYPGGTGENYYDIDYLKIINPYTSSEDLYFDDIRFRFVYRFKISEEFDAPIEMYLCISIPYFLGVSNTYLTTYVYEPFIEKLVTADDWLTANGFNNPNYNSDMNYNEDRLLEFVSSNQNQGWFTQSNIISTLGSGFLTGFRGSSHLVERLYHNVPFIRSLIYFSVSLGLAGFILNLGTSILGHFTSSKKGR